MPSLCLCVHLLFCLQRVCILIFEPFHAHARHHVAHVRPPDRRLPPARGCVGVPDRTGPSDDLDSGHADARALDRGRGVPDLEQDGADDDFAVAQHGREYAFTHDPDMYIYIRGCTRQTYLAELASQVDPMRKTCWVTVPGGVVKAGST